MFLERWKFWKKKPEWQALCREVFTKDGFRYFKYIDEDKIPIKRFEQSEIIFLASLLSMIVLLDKFIQ